MLFTLLTLNFIANAQESGNNANEIIEKTLLYKTKNKITNYEFTTYNKLLITASSDSIEGRIDSIYSIKKGRKTFSKIDSSDFIFKKIISKQHLFQTEKISRFISYKNSLQETILANRMAGFKKPVFEYFSLQLEPFSVYNQKYSLAEKEYINPISKKGIKKYNFYFLKNTLLQNRKVSQIRFQTKEKIKNNKLEGYYFIDQENYSIAKLLLNVSGILNIQYQCEFTYNEEIKNWFPHHKKLTLKKGHNKYPIKIFGETIIFEGSENRENENHKKFASDFIEIKSETRIYEPKFNSTKKINNKDVAVIINENSSSKKLEIWNSYATDSIDVRSNPTYISLDSLAEKRKIEKKINIGRKVIKGYYPVGFFDFDFRYIFRYNNYEGFRLGLGGVTNEKLSKTYKLEGYAVYGTKDGYFKGFLSNTFRLDKQNETWIGASYNHDLKEIASTSFEVDKRVFKIYDPRPFNISTFYNHETWRGFIETKVIPKTESIWQLSSSFITPKFDYQFENNDKRYTNFRTTLFTASIQWNPFSNYMQTPSGNIEIDKKYPKFTFQFTKTISNLLENSFNFGKLDFRFDYQKKFNSNHKFLFLFEGGYASGDIPLTHVYNHSPNNLNKDKLLQRITIAGRDSFETMYFNEFFSSKYVFFQLEYQFPKFEIARKIKPIFSLVSRFSWGEFDDKKQHQKINFKTLENGFLESGFEVNNIFKGLGFVAFYRYGSNHLPDFEDNIALKLSLQLDLGFNN
ncbi:DUF5686 family protein [Flavobacterium sp.]|uniref:DUF5686 family protein n=1 Tax=Flavobacterium sp. TaxID=239 RepID=UPI00286E5292|nr:DUF5686 family protein [Flavobacterium sp.]